MTEVHTEHPGSDLHGLGNRARPWVFWAILLLIVLLIAEACAAAVVQFLLSSRAAYILWRPDLAVAADSWKNSAVKMDEELGWSLAEDVTRDASGAKVNSDFAGADKPCLSAYGDSFIWGEDIPLQDGWIEQMSRRLGCRIANYGVSGYGTDQAFLRFRRIGHDRAPVVILGILPDNIARNVNQYRGLVGWGLQPFFVKGRFVVDSSRNLQWIPRPRLDVTSFVELHRNPQTLLPNEYFLPDTRDGPVTVRFPYTLTLARFGMAPRVWNRLRGRTPWAELYSPDHPSGAVRTTIEITKAFIQEAERRAARVFVIMMPDAGSFRAWNYYGAADYAAFVKAMNAEGLDIFDPLPALLRSLAGQSYCDLFVESVPRLLHGLQSFHEATCQGHFNVAGSALLAEIVASELRSRQLLSTSERPINAR